MLVAEDKAGHRQARHVVSKVEVSVFEVGVADVGLIDFEVVSELEIVLAFCPVDHVPKIVGVADEMRSVKLPIVKSPATAKLQNSALRGRQLVDG